MIARIEFNFQSGTTKYFDENDNEILQEDALREIGG